MKKITFAFFTIYSITLFSQEKTLDSILNFKLTKNDIIWQKIYPVNDSSKIVNIKNQIQSQEFTHKLKIVNNSYNGRSENHGKRLVKNTPYYATWGFDTFLKIEFKKNKYRVTASDFIFRGPLLNVYGVQKKQDYPLKSNIIRKNKFKNNRKSIKVLTKLDSVLNSKFTIQKTKENDW